MLTDDDLTNELGAAFRASAGDLTYAGRRRPRRTAVVAVPAVAVGASLAAVAIAATVNAGSDPAQPQNIHAGGILASQAPSTPARGSLVTEKVQVAGYTFTYQHAKGETTPPLIATMATDLPDGLTPISAPNDVKAWVGKDPRGDNAIYVKAPTRNGGALFELHSSVWTQDELVDLFHNGTPKTVPLVKE